MTRAFRRRRPQAFVDAIRVGSVYRGCQRLFGRYPLAVRVANRTGTVRSMVLAVRDGDDAGFYVLSNRRDADQDLYQLKRWRGESLGSADAHRKGDLPRTFSHVLLRGVPVPRDGSVFGWKSEDGVTALVTIHVHYTPAHPEPSWSLMLLADVPDALWPPFIEEPHFGSWFWKHYQAGRIVWLDNLIAATPDTVFWVDTEAILDSDCCIVAQDIQSKQGYILRHGRYVYDQALEDGKQVPSLATLLASPDKKDLATRF